MGGDLVITRPCYCNTDDVARALDFKPGLLVFRRLERAIQSAADNIEGHLHRLFYPWDGTRFLDWPNYQYAEPWRFWLGRRDLVMLTELLSPGNTGGAAGTPIPLWQVLLEPVDRRPGFPFDRIDLDRSTVAAWGAAPTPQHAIWAAGTWGFTADSDQVTTLAADISNSVTTITVADGSRTGVGNLLVLAPGRGQAPFPAYLGTAGAIAPYTGERVLVTGRAAADTGLAQSGAGCSTAMNSDSTLIVTGPGALFAGEVIRLDSERMLVEEVAGPVVSVTRAWDGTDLSPHSSAEIWAYRQLTVLRGQLGTTAASASEGAVVALHRTPPLIHDLAIAEGIDRVLQEPAGYARMAGSGDAARPAPGASLGDLWAEAMTTYGRKARVGAI